MQFLSESELFSFSALLNVLNVSLVQLFTLLWLFTLILFISNEVILDFSLPLPYRFACVCSVRSARCVPCARSAVAARSAFSCPFCVLPIAIAIAAIVRTDRWRWPEQSSQRDEALEAQFKQLAARLKEVRAVDTLKCSMSSTGPATASLSSLDRRPLAYRDHSHVDSSPMPLPYAEGPQSVPERWSGFRLVLKCSLGFKFCFV